MKKIQESPLANTSIFTIVWALSIFFSKIAYNNGANVLPFIVQSTIVAIVFSMIFLLPGLIREFRTISKNEFLSVVIINIIHFGFGALLSNVGFAQTSAINSGFLVQFATVWVIVLSFLILSEKIKFPGFLTLVLLIFGSYFLSTNGKRVSFQDGDLLVIAATFCWALANVLSRKLLVGSNVSPNMIAFLRPISGLPVILLAMSISSMLPSKTGEVFKGSLLEVEDLVLVLLTGILTVLILVFLNRSLKYATANYLSIVSSSVSVIVAFLAICFLGESIGMVQVIGAILVILAGIVPNMIRIDKKV